MKQWHCIGCSDAPEDSCHLEQRQGQERPELCPWTQGDLTTLPAQKGKWLTDEEFDKYREEMGHEWK